MQWSFPPTKEDLMLNENTQDYQLKKKQFYAI